MSTRMKRIVTHTALAVVALVSLALGGAGLYAYGQSVGSDQVAAEVRDAGPGVVDARAVAFDPAQPDRSAPTATTVPSPEKPGELFELTKDAREIGGLWLAIVVVVFAIAAWIRKRTALKPGEEEPDPKSWRARSYAISESVAGIAATLIDIGFGSVGWGALALPIAFAVGRVMEVANPPKGSKAKAAEGETK